MAEQGVAKAGICTDFPSLDCSGLTMRMKRQRPTNATAAPNSSAPQRQGPRVQAQADEREALWLGPDVGRRRHSSAMSSAMAAERPELGGSTSAHGTVMAAAAHGATAVSSTLLSAASAAVGPPAPPGYPSNWDIVANDQHTSAICGHPAALVPGPYRTQVWLGLFLYLLIAKDGLVQHFGVHLFYYIIFLIVLCFLPDLFYEAPPPPPVAAGYWEDYLARSTPSPPPLGPRIDGPERGGISWAYRD